jgi:transcriptional regulator EpsA
MDDVTALKASEQTALWRALSASLDIFTRGQFFLWAQGQLQALIPHDLLVCARLDEGGQLKHIDVFHGVPLEPEVMEALKHPQTGLVVRMALVCAQAKLSQVVFQSDQQAPEQPLKGLFDDMRAHQLGAALFKYTGLTANGASFFAFFKLREPPSDMRQLLLRLLLPNLNLVFSRIEVQGVLAADPEAQLPLTDDESDLTDRQLEILHWVKLGKTNQEIAQILEISALTVKNHMQKLFKKLNVHNRAQAVARVMDMRLPGHTPDL